MSDIDLRNLLWRFLASLTLCDHMGDVANDVDKVLKELGEDIEWNDLGELGDELARRNIKTLYGTSMRENDDDAE